jgi:hypothetical protein
MQVDAPAASHRQTPKTLVLQIEKRVMNPVRAFGGQASCAPSHTKNFCRPMWLAM